MCCSEEDINITNPFMATACLILNIFLPGIGTIVNACSGVQICPGLLWGILQILTAPILIGWIWSIFYGIQIVEVAGKARYMVPVDMRDEVVVVVARDGSGMQPQVIASTV